MEMINRFPYRIEKKDKKIKNIKKKKKNAEKEVNQILYK